MVKETGCDGVMIARGAQGNPVDLSEMIEHERTGEDPIETDERRNPENDAPTCKASASI